MGLFGVSEPLHLEVPKSRTPRVGLTVLAQFEMSRRKFLRNRAGSGTSTLLAFRWIGVRIRGNYTGGEFRV